MLALKEIQEAPMKSLTRLSSIFTVAVILAVSGTALHAQGTGPTTPAGERHRVPADSARRAALQAHQNAAKAERKSLAAQVKAGTLTKAQAHDQMHAWKSANKMSRKPRKP